MKKINLKTLMILLAGLFALTFTSCGDDGDDGDDTPNPKPVEEPAKYLISTTVKNPDGMSGSSFMKLVSDFSGSIDNSNSIPVNFGIGIGVRENNIYLFPTFGKDGDANLTKYIYHGTKELRDPQILTLPPNSGASNITVVNSEKMYLPAYNVGKVYIVNPKTMEKTGEIDLSQYAHTDNNPEPANGIIRDGLYYLPLDQVGSDYMPYPDYHQVDVVIINPETDKVEKVISEKESNFSFPTRPMDSNKGMIFTDEQNDIYIACTGNFGYNPEYLNNGFVCIPAGKTEFDSSKSWDISNTIIEGTNYKPASVYNCKYIGAGKMVAYVGVFEMLDPTSPYTSRNSMAVLIDLNDKTIKKIEGIPATDGHSICIAKYKNLIIIGAYGADKVGFFSYNPQTEEVIHEVTTEGNPIGFHYFE